MLCQCNTPRSGYIPGHLQPLQVSGRISAWILLDHCPRLRATITLSWLYLTDSVRWLTSCLASYPLMQPALIADLFVELVSWLHGLPQSVGTDRSSHFLNQLNQYQALCMLVGYKHAGSSTYHPRLMVRLRKRIGLTLSEMLRQSEFVNSQCAVQ